MQTRASSEDAAGYLHAPPQGCRRSRCAAEGRPHLQRAMAMRLRPLQAQRIVVLNRSKRDHRRAWRHDVGRPCRHTILLMRGEGLPCLCEARTDPVVARDSGKLAEPAFGRAVFRALPATDAIPRHGHHSRGALTDRLRMPASREKRSGGARGTSTAAGSAPRWSATVILASVIWGFYRGSSEAAAGSSAKHVRNKLATIRHLLGSRIERSVLHGHRSGHCTLTIALRTPLARESGPVERTAHPRV